MNMRRGRKYLREFLIWWEQLPAAKIDPASISRLEAAPTATKDVRILESSYPASFSEQGYV
jgi:hypothetical protein